MVNWKAHKTASQVILILSALVLFGLGGILGINSLQDKVFNLVTWSQAIGAGLLYVAYTFSSLIRG